MKSEITLPLPELKHALTGLNKIVSKKPSLPVLGHIKISRTASGKVQLEGTDLDGFATYTIEGSQPGEALEVLLPLEQLNKAYKCSKQDVAVLVDGESTKLRFSLGGSLIEQPVPALPVNEWPPCPSVTATSSPLAPGFGLALKQALASCSEDATRHTLQGACLDAREKSAHYIVGTDGRMLFAANSFTFPLKDSIIIRDSKFITGSGLLDEEPCFFAVQPAAKASGAKHILLHNQRWHFVSREIEGQYPNWKQVIPVVDNKWTKIQLSPAAVEQLLQVIPKLPGSDRQDKDVRLCIEKEFQIEGRGKDDEQATFIPIKDVKITGKSQSISINREYLVNALKFGLDEWAIQDELTPLIASNKGRRIVIMPLRPPANTIKPAAPVTTPTSEPERKTEMPKTPNKIEPPQPEPISLMDQIEKLKESLRTVLRELSDLADNVKAAEKDRRSQEKEVEAARATLKKLQQVTI